MIRMLIHKIYPDITNKCHHPTKGDNPTPVTTATIPYIKDTYETIAQILQPYNMIRVAHKPITTLRQLLTNVKDKDKPNDREGAVYKIKCSNYQATYIGETGRNLNKRLTEQNRNERLEMVTSPITLLNTIYQLITESTGTLLNVLSTVLTTYYQRLTLKSWFTNLEQKPLNRRQQLRTCPLQTTN